MAEKFHNSLRRSTSPVYGAGCWKIDVKKSPHIFIKCPQCDELQVYFLMKRSTSDILLALTPCFRSQQLNCRFLLVSRATACSMGRLSQKAIIRKKYVNNSFMLCVCLHIRFFDSLQFWPDGFSRMNSLAQSRAWENELLTFFGWFHLIVNKRRQLKI